MPDYREFVDQIFHLLKPFQKEGQTLNEESELVAELGLDSLQVMELILEIEDHFDISVPLNNLTYIKTVKDLANQLEQLTKS